MTSKDYSIWPTKAEIKEVAEELKKETKLAIKDLKNFKRKKK